MLPQKGVELFDTLVLNEVALDTLVLNEVEDPLVREVELVETEVCDVLVDLPELCDVLDPLVATDVLDPPVQVKHGRTVVWRQDWL